MSNWVRRLAGRLPKANHGVGRHVLGQTGWLTVAKLCQGATSLASTLVVARWLGPDAFGQLSLVITTAVLCGSIATLGLENIATRELSRDAAFGSVNRDVLPALQSIRWAGAIGGCLLLVLGAAVSPPSRYGVAGLLLILSLLPLAQAGDVAEWRLIAARQGNKVALVVMAVSPLAAVARIALAMAGAPMIAFAWTLVAEWFSRSVFLSLLARHTPTSALLPGKTTPTRTRLLRDAFPLMLAGIAVYVYMRIDQFMIAAMLGRHQLGLYSASASVSEAPLILPAILLKVLLPVLARQGDEAAAERTLTRAMRGSFYFHLIVAAVLVAVSGPLVTALYGPTYAGASTAFSIQVISAPFVSLGVLSSAWLVIGHRTGHAVRRTLLGALTNIALNLVLIPRYGIAGAALATLIAQVVATLLADLCFQDTRVLFRIKMASILGKSWTTA